MSTSDPEEYFDPPERGEYHDSHIGDDTGPNYDDGTPRKPVQLALWANFLPLPKNTFTYPPLANGEDIRILLIKEGRWKDPIECKLVPIALPSAGRSSTAPFDKYEALSYYWGIDDQPRQEIIITNYTRTKKPFSAVDVAAAKLQRPGWQVKGKFYIRPNLEAAMRRLRLERGDVPLWVDALCIDQQNDEEKNSQVARMHEIYSNASNVCVWLGEGSSEGIAKSDNYLILDNDGSAEKLETSIPKRTFDFLRTILDLGTLDSIIKEEKHPKEWKLVADLMENRWFSRRWVIQELALARKATVHFGKEILKWSDFSGALALFHDKYDLIKPILQTQSTRPPNKAIPDIDALGANALIDITRNLFRRSKDGVVVQCMMNLEALVSSLVAFEATDPRDTIYAVLSIAQDTFSALSNFGGGQNSNDGLDLPQLTSYDFGRVGSVLRIQVARSFEQSTVGPRDPRISADYNKSLADVFVEFMSYCIDTSNSLDILCRNWAPLQIGKMDPAKFQKFLNFEEAPKASVEMPSWIPSIANSSYGQGKERIAGRKHADSLVGIPNRHNQPNYNASYHLSPCVEFGLQPSQSSSVQSEDLDSDLRLSMPGQFDPPLENRIPSIPTVLSLPKTTAKEIRLAPEKFDGVLSVKGVLCSQIQETSQRLASGIIFKEALKLIGWRDGIKPVPDEVWRTLVADRGPNGRNTPNWYPTACQESLKPKYRSTNGDLHIRPLLDWSLTPSNMKRFLDRVLVVIYNRIFIRLKGDQSDTENKHGLLGVAPPDTKVGDVVCVLFGCSVPVVLRKLPEEGYYRFVGECYIHGLMDGEALLGMDLKYPFEQSETFKLR